MNKKQKIFYILIGMFIGILFSAGLAWFVAFQRWVGFSFPSSQYKNGEEVFNPGIPPPIHPSYSTDFSSNKNLMGGSHNIFIAKVIAQTRNKETSVGPRTQYSVEIVQNIKGNLSGIVTLDQLGGYKNGQLVIVEDSTLEGYLLQPGATYLLATRYNDKENWHTLNPHGNASKLLTSDANLSDTALQALADKDEKVKTLEAAYPNEVLLDADIANQNTRNAFTTLPPEAKAAAQARADAARAALGASVNGQ